MRSTDPAVGPRTVVGFARVLRAVGLPVPVDSTRLFADAIGVLGAGDAETVYWAGRATLCRRPEHVEMFDACFRSWFGWEGDDPRPELAPREVVVAFDGGDPPGSNDETGTGAVRTAPVFAVRFSPAESLRDRDFATLDAAEHRELRRALAELRVRGPRRRSRRQRPARRSHRTDVRATLRAAMRTGGEPFDRRFRAPAVRPRRLVVLCDVSGSMEAYARVVVRFLHSAVVARGQVEAFAMGTRLTRLTRELAHRDPDAALAAAARRVVDWSGGTRLGAALAQFNAEWGVRGMARGAVVVIVSDGWDRGDSALLGEQMARLRRVAHRVIWVNPLKASPGYAPLAAGMAAALPWVDDFVEGHSLSSLASLVDVIDAASGRPGR